MAEECGKPKKNKLILSPYIIIFMLFRLAWLFYYYLPAKCGIYYIYLLILSTYLSKYTNFETPEDCYMNVKIQLLLPFHRSFTLRTSSPPVNGQ